MATIRVCALENEPMANLVCSVLKKHRIPYTLIRTHDSVLDGIGEGQLDWGYIEAPERYSARINQIVADLSPKGAKPTSKQAEHAKRKLPARAKVALALAPLLLLLVAYYTMIALTPRYKGYFYYNVGITFSRLGLKSAALSSYSRAISFNPQLAFAYRARARAYRGQGELEKAIADYSAAIELEPLRFEAYYGRALARSAQRDYAEAIADFSRAIELNPRYEYAYVGRGVDWAREGNSENALSDYNKALALDPKDALVYYDRGILFERKGAHEQAIKDFSTAIELDPRYANAYEYRAYILHKLGRGEEAAKDAAKAEALRKGR